MATKKNSTAPRQDLALHQGAGEVLSPADIDALGSFGGFQTEISQDDLALPFLIVLQPLSPQVTTGDPTYIEGARPGKILQTVDKTIHDSVLLVVVDYKRSFIEWVPRDKGGGFRGETSSDAASEAEFTRRINRATGKAKLDSGNDWVDTRSFFVLTAGKTEEDTDIISPALVSMASTQIKVARNWLTMIQTYVPPGAHPKPGQVFPPWTAIYGLSTVHHKNEKGQWWGWKVERMGVNRNPVLVEQAKGFYASIRTGAVKVDRTAMDQDVDSGDARTADGM